MNGWRGESLSPFSLDAGEGTCSQASISFVNENLEKDRLKDMFLDRTIDGKNYESCGIRDF